MKPNKQEIKRALFIYIKYLTIAFILSEIGEKAYLVKDLLEKAANDPDPEVKEDVLETLSKIKLYHQS